MQQQLVELFIFHDFFLYQIAPQNIAMKLELTGILIGLSLLVFVAAMAEAKKEGRKLLVTTLVGWYYYLAHKCKFAAHK